MNESELRNAHERNLRTDADVRHEVQQRGDLGARKCRFVNKLRYSVQNRCSTFARIHWEVCSAVAGATVKRNHLSAAVQAGVLHAPGNASLLCTEERLTRGIPSCKGTLWLAAANRNPRNG